ncbi:hypothetical protein CERZMDRAFT_102600 [Cercospora zeae-maydis SCOH1-5]|uniref:2EXR domain-containing protein n=1 Tax=Cercospora zeae-maydis SCOH1-5 TaxID=717836 RepID=A0A6A6F1K8_9PEZI|nr:hypothetical protein CERZMDRAFT_102600 [Cercospora zeae-maydis SCOH1-5]
MPGPNIPVKGCNIFDKLPAEMRNKIWELSFANDHEEVELWNLSPPNKSLLLTCKQARSEAGGLYPDAYRAYWATSRFKITLLESKSSVAEFGRWCSLFDGATPYQTRMWHNDRIQDLTIVLVHPGREKTFRCLEESIFLNVEGGCKKKISITSNNDDHWTGKTYCHVYAPPGLTAEGQRNWLQKVEEGEADTKFGVMLVDNRETLSSQVDMLLQDIDFFEHINAYLGIGTQE